MAQLLIELFSEEIPARMQGGAARDLERMASERLKAAGLTYEALTTFAGPRRLTLVVEGLPKATPDREEEVKGPRANAPEQALEGFLRKTGLTKDQLVERDGVFFAVLSSQGQPTAWPAYRMEWQAAGSLERRLRACFLGVRAEMPAYRSEDLLALQVFLAQRAQGLALEAPGVRR